MSLKTDALVQNQKRKRRVFLRWRQVYLSFYSKQISPLDQSEIKVSVKIIST